MKHLWTKVKWISNQAKPFFPFLFLIVFIGSISSLVTISMALVTKKLVDSAISSHIHMIVECMIMLFVLFMFSIISQALISVLSVKISAKITNNIQKKTYKKFTLSAWSECSRYHSGDILTRMTSDVDSITNLIVNVLPNIASLFVLLIGSFIMLFYFSPLLSFLALILAPLTILISRIFVQRLKITYIKTQKLEGKYRSFINEFIQNIVIIKTFNLEETSLNNLTKIQNDRLELLVSSSRTSAVSTSIFSLGSWLGFFIVMIWGSFNISNGTITYGTLTALLQLFSNIQSPFSGLATSLPKMVSAIASSERIIELESLEVDLNNSQISNLSSAGIHFENVYFSYKKYEPVLKNISATIYPGEIVAFVGKSGKGKTTLVRLILSLIHPEKGHAYITENCEKYEISSDSRNLISYVPQGNTLFSGTIADNLRFGNANASYKDLELAARAACAWEFIHKLDAGLETVIGEHGIGLSEGQSQRIAIARALIRKTPILLLDEATSSLDKDTEIEVLRNIRNLSPIPTCLIITHRQAALKICNKVYTLEDGFLTEDTNHISNNLDYEAI